MSVLDKLLDAVKLNDDYDEDDYLDDDLLDSDDDDFLDDDQAVSYTHLTLPTTPYV